MDREEVVEKEKKNVEEEENAFVDVFKSLIKF